MATIILGSYMVRYPLGGNLSWALQYLVGFKDLGHDIYFVEKYAYPDSCYNPMQQVEGDDCSYGLKVVSQLLKTYGLEDKWCFVERGDIYHGLSKKDIEEVFKRADLYIESGAHGAWDEEASWVANTAYIDVDPGYSHIKLHNDLESGRPVPIYDRYFTIGINIGKEDNIIPTVGLKWKYILNPVNTRLFTPRIPVRNAPYSTIMNWRSYATVRFKGESYGQKDVEFEKFISLPLITNAPFEVAISGGFGRTFNSKKLLKNKWTLNDAQRVTISFDAFQNYIAGCKGEFSVCKNVYVATQSGWFSDKSAAFLASGRPVILQDTGFGNYLPLGEGLFAVKTKEEAKEAIEKVESNYSFHSKKAREIACEYFEATTVLDKFLTSFCF
jgi:hypothetical protein